MQAVFLSAFVLLFLGTCRGHEGHHNDQETEASLQAAEKIRKKITDDKWEISDLVDMEHLQAELRDVLKLQENGQLSPEEASVYMFRTHDFDRNNQLDGVELGAILRHSIGENATDELVEKAVDGTLSLDTNNDGFISYPELKYQLDKQKTDAELEAAKNQS